MAVAREPLIEAPSLREQVRDRLRRAILAGELTAGTKLSPPAIAHELGVSTMPVREALRVLADEGLVEMAPRRWTRVASPQPRLIDEVYPLVALLEEYAVSDGTRQTEGFLQALRRANARLERAGQDRDVVGCMAADSAFHDVLVEASENGTLRRSLGELKAQIRLLESAYYRADDAGASYADHERIIDALAAGDRRRAGQLVRANWVRGAGVLRRLVAPEI
jgi:DNA-binding GntR family transcriptional regulator